MSSNVPEIISSSVPMSVGSNGGNSSRGLQRSSIPHSPGEKEDEDDGKHRAAMTTDNAELAQQSQSSSTSNVGELVTKAKKAAASLWMILHAQVSIVYFIRLIRMQFYFPRYSCIDNIITRVHFIFSVI